jgi:hypothetical protein
MKCIKCGAQLYKGTSHCVRCGYSLNDEMEYEKKEHEKITISSNPKINFIYQKIFGINDKKVILRYFKFILIIFIFLFLNYHFFFYLDISNRCFIKIRPALTEFSNTTIKKGIVYLKKNFPSEYKDMCENVSTINPNISCGGFGGGCYSEFRFNPGVIDISTAFGQYKRAAKVIIHETCHAIQLKEGRSFDESECYGKDSVIPW